MDNRALVCVADPVLLDEVLRLAAAAGCTVDRVPDAVAARPRAPGARLVVLDHQAAAQWRAAGPAGHPRLVLVYREDGEHTEELWRNALAMRALRVVKVPEGEQWLVSAFADAADGPPVPVGPVLAVLGGRGGAGASVFAAALGLTVLRRRTSGFLLDCDPNSGGLDLVVGADDLAGPRWSDLKVQSGRVSATSLRAALPARRHGDAVLSVLACRRGGDRPSPDAVAAVVDAGSRAGGPVICDLPRFVGPAGEAVLSRADLAVLVLPAELRACAAAAGVVAGLRARGVHTVAVVRGPSPTGLVADEVADALELPLLAGMRPQPGIAKALELGEFTVPSSSPLGRAAGAVLDHLAGHRSRA